MTSFTIATLGDSILAGTPGWDPDPALREKKKAFDEESQLQYWAAKESPELVFRNYGVAGERTDEIALRLESALVGASAMLVQGGINDIVQERPIAGAVSSTVETAKRARDLGLPVALADVLPWNNGWPEKADRVDAFNSLLHEMAAEAEIKVLPFYRTLSSDDAPGRMPEEWTSDGNHPSVEGYRRLGTLAFEPWW